MWNNQSQWNSIISKIMAKNEEKRKWKRNNEMTEEESNNENG